MLEEKLRGEIQNLLKEVGVWFYHPPDDLASLRNKNVSFSRPDIYGLNPRGPTIIIEVKKMDPKKRIEPWLSPKEISDGQRQWLDNWVYECQGPGYLAVGTSDQPRRAWIVPWEDWIKMENELYALNPEFHIKESNLPNEYELIWNTGGTWSLPTFHPILQFVSEIGRPPDSKNWKANKISLRFEKEKE